MARAHRIAWIVAVLVGGCTPGGMNGAAGNGGGSGPAPAIVNVSLTAYAAAATSAGLGGGYSPLTSTLAVGSTLRFVNADTFAHTASAVAGPTFPASSPLGASAQSASGTLLSGSWSSGTLQPGASSQTLTVDKPGTYLFGCFFHYGAPMRGEIVAF